MFSSKFVICYALTDVIHLSFKEQVDRVNRLRDDTVRAILKNTNDILMFKEEVSRHLSDLREFVEAD